MIRPGCSSAPRRYAFAAPVNAIRCHRSAASGPPHWRAGHRPCKPRRRDGSEAGGRQVAVRAVSRPGVADDSAVDYSGPKATLDRATVWRLQMALEEGAPPAVVHVRFAREEGYEPPQGVIEVVEDERGTLQQGASTRWELGEDPDKKSANPMDGGGLWIWALFSETPFPCMLFSLATNEYGTVYVKATHGQGPKRGTVLTDGVLSTRTMTEVAADLIGLSRAQVAEQLPAGTIRIAPLGCY
eukprot:jgi/Tetstr1/430979/TSEL_020734.t1